MKRGQWWTHGVAVTGLLPDVGRVGLLTGARPSSFLELRHASTDRAIVVDVPERRLFAIDGLGDPASDAFRLGTQALRAAEAALNVRLGAGRFDGDRTAVLECVWGTVPELALDEIEAAFADRSTWHWQQMVAMPERATDRDAESAIGTARQGARKSAARVRGIGLSEGQSAQLLHIGAVETEAMTLGKLYRAIAEAGLRPRGHIHELRLADERDVGPERARAIIRVPVGPA
jgi:hypothetical protein